MEWLMIRWNVKQIEEVKWGWIIKDGTVDDEMEFEAD
jgi:hypothetical protein